jgi:hypothetical protein
MGVAAQGRGASAEVRPGVHSECGGPVPAEHPAVAFLDLRGAVGSGDARAARQVAAAPQTGVPPAEQVVGTAVVSDVARDVQAVEALYESLLAARRTVGMEEPLPFDRFAEVVKGQVSRLQREGSREVAFCVAVKGGKVAFTARGSKGSDDAS